MNGIALVVLTGTIVTIVASVVAYLLLLRQAHRHSLQLRFEHGRFHNEHLSREEAESNLRLKDQLYRILFAHTSDVVLLFGITPDGLPGKVREANAEACRLLEYEPPRLSALSLLDFQVYEQQGAVPGYTRAELVTLSDEQILDRESTFAVRPLRQFVQRVLDEKHVHTSETWQTRSGKRLPVELDAHRVDLMGEPMILITARDISERQQAARALHESEQRFQEFFSHSPLGVALYDRDRRLLDVNQACLKMFGAPDADNFGRFNIFDNPFLPETVRQALARADTAMTPVTIDFESVRSGNLFLTARRGKAHLNMLILNLGMTPDYQPRGWLLQVEDVTRRVQTEEALRQSERQLQQAQKMEALGTLAGGIAHDFNNILTAILGYTEIMLHILKDGEDGTTREFLEEIHKASYRARDLVQQILTFSRQGEHQNRPIRLIPIVKEVLKLQRASLPATIESECVIRTDKDTVLANPTQIHQVLMNLCTNAAYAMRETGGRLDVTLTDFLAGVRGGHDAAELEPGRYLCISVRDTGSGIDEKTLQRVFEPFFTTKPRGEGTGMGLAVVHGIVTSLKGTIRCESRPGEGTTFHVLLPVVEAAQTEDDVTHEPAAAGGGATILFVDDEPAIVRLAARMLRAMDYDPVIACDGNEALELFRADPDQFDLVITDLAMPNLSGPELARELAAIRPDLPVLLCTGFSRRYSLREAEDDGFRGVIKKPIIMRQLADAVASALGAGRNERTADS